MQLLSFRATYINESGEVYYYYGELSALTVNMNC